MKRTFRHVLARLRERLGNLTQKQLAEYAGVSTATIQAIELKKLKLSPRLAFKISEATGVDYNWLLKNDLMLPPINQDKEPYSQADLIRAEGKSLKQERMSRLKGKMELTQAYHCLRRVWEETVTNPDELTFFLFRLKQYVESEVSRIRELREEPINRESHHVIQYSEDASDGEKVKLLRSWSYPSLIPVDGRSFKLMKSDVYECEKAFEEHRANVEKEAERLRNPEIRAQIRAQQIATREALLASARERKNVDPSPTKAPTAKPRSQKKSQRTSR